MSIKLKIKIKSLAEEARIIRKEERKLLRQLHHVNDTKERIRLESLRISIEQHRKMDVRRESRASNLAYAFLRGQAFREVEPTSSFDKLFYEWRILIPKIAYMVGNYGPKRRVKFTTNMRLEPLPEVVDEVVAWLSS